MELIPELSLGWFNGWILLSALYLVEAVMVLSFPKESRGRLFEYDRSKWSRRQRASFVVGKSLALICIVMIALSPLKIGVPLFVPGLVIYITGLAGFTVALLNYRNTPLGRPATTGIYGLSRHPQVFSLWVVVLGICLVIGSWFALSILVLSVFFNHQRNVAEEEACLEQYGAAYREYMERVPRYFLFL